MEGQEQLALWGALFRTDCHYDYSSILMRGQMTMWLNGYLMFISKVWCDCITEDTSP